ncbi:MAG: CapA family protein [Bacteroidota bacterium]
MNATKHYKYLIILIVFVVSCKVKQTPVDWSLITEEIDNITLPDSIPEIYITQLGDTLLSLDSELDIPIYRLTKDSITVIGVGDIMMGTNYPEKNMLPINGGADLLSDVDSILKSADITFGNLEGVILNSGGTPKYCSNKNLCFAFRTPESYITHLVDAGFDVMSTANNHAGDFGNTGRRNTMKVLDSVGIAHAGLLLQPYTTFKKDGIKYGFTAFAPNTGTQSINNPEAAKAIVQHLDSISDIVIVSFHGGAEGSKHQHVTKKREVFYGENRGNVYEFSHQMIDAGADIIFGHGPHVTRAMEIYKNRFIAYSLGNFCTYGRFNVRGVNGLAPIVKLWVNMEGEFLRGYLTPIKQTKKSGPKIDGNKEVFHYINTLIREDFPDSQLKVGDNGEIIHSKNQ